MKVSNFGKVQLKASCCQVTISWLFQIKVLMLFVSVMRKQELLKTQKVSKKRFIRLEAATTWKLSQTNISCLLANTTTTDRFASKNNTKHRSSPKKMKLSKAEIPPNSRTSIRSNYMISLLESSFWFRVYIVVPHLQRSLTWSACSHLHISFSKFI